MTGIPTCEFDDDIDRVVQDLRVGIQQEDELCVRMLDPEVHTRGKAEIRTRQDKFHFGEFYAYQLHGSIAGVIIDHDDLLGDGFFLREDTFEASPDMIFGVVRYDDDGYISFHGGIQR